MRKAVRWIVVVCCLLAGLPPATAERRVALVIGNASYGHHTGLPNVPNDAAAMAALFRAANFDSVEAKHNLGLAELRRALREFAGRAADADVAVLFFAGHGIEVDRVNYLVPVDARLASDLDVEDEAVSLDRALQVLEQARRLRLVILDACRDSPFIKSMRRTSATRSVSRGLGRIDPSSSNTLIAFATKPNAVAEDGKGSHSPFTAALVKHLLTPGLDLRMALGHVRDDVRHATNNKQEPYFTGSLGGGVFSLVGPLATTALPGGQPADRPQVNHAERAWVAVKDSTSIAALEMFRREFGAANLVYDRLAEARIEELTRRAAKADALATVRSFYTALGSADGVRASSLVIPEKRAHGPFSAAEISKFYGSLAEPLRLTNIVALADDKFQVDYTFRSGKRSCNGFAIVTVVRRDGRPLIEGIKANC